MTVSWPLVALVALIIASLAGGAFLLKRLAWPSMASPDGRRFWAFVVILGGCFIFTLFAAVGVWLVSKNVTYTFYLALAAHVQLFVGMSTFGFILGRRPKGRLGKDGMEWDDTASEPHQQPTITTTTTVTPPTGETA